MASGAFLTENIAAMAVEHVVSTLMESGVRALLGDNPDACHIAIFVPKRMKQGPEWWTGYKPPQPKLLYERSFGDKEQWPYPLDEIAPSKAQQLWENRNDDRTDILPHLLARGDTPFWGGVKRYGFVVACSGFRRHMDKMISGMISDMCIALAYDAWMESDDKRNDVNFLT